MATLYVVATPIGNLEDVSYRVVRVLSQVTLIAAEDTRVARKLLSRYGIRNRLLSYNDHNQRTRIPQILEALARGDVALVSDAGTPALSDPGRELVRAVVAQGYRASPIPGPSAVTAALAVSGLPGEGVLFLGFLPRRRRERGELLSRLAQEPSTLVLFEAPHRLRETLPHLLEALGDREVAVCREMTKLYEEVFHGKLSQAMHHFQEPLGEFTLVVAGAPSRPASTWDLETARQRLDLLRAEGVSRRAAVAQVTAESNLPRRVVYRLGLETQEGTPGPPSRPPL